MKELLIKGLHSISGLVRSKFLKHSANVLKFSLAATAAAGAAKSLQSCPTLCDPIDGSPPGSAIPGILQARSGLPFPSPAHESEN